MGDIAAGLAFNVAAAQMTRPADITAYASGDLVANDTVAGGVAPLSFGVGADIRRGVTITRVRLRKSSNVTTGAVFRVHLFRRPPTVTNGDNGAFMPNEADDYLGFMDVESMQGFSDGAVGLGAPGVGQTVTFRPAIRHDVYALLEARGAYTPTSGETFDVTLEGYAD